MVHLHIGVHMFVGFWMQHFQTGGLRETVRQPGHHDRRISPPLDFFLWGCVKDKVFSTPVPDITNLKARITDVFVTVRHVGEHVERNLLSIRRSPCNKRSTCWSVLKCCKKNFFELHFEKKSLYSTYSSFLVINVCNQGKTLCSPCTMTNDVSLSMRLNNMSLEAMSATWLATGSIPGRGWDILSLHPGRQYILFSLPSIYARRGCFSLHLAVLCGECNPSLQSVRGLMSDFDAFGNTRFASSFRVS